MMRNISLKKSVFLISLALLFPEIVVSKTLDMNYDNSADLALSPRSALQLNACHTKADPMLINVNFDPMILGSNFTVTLEINGDTYTKNYTAFTPPEKLPLWGSAAGVDNLLNNPLSKIYTDFQIPWRVFVNGISAGAQGSEVQKPEVTETKYSGAFCFDRKYNQKGTGANDAWPSGGYIPIFVGGGEYSDGNGHRVKSHPASTCDIPERPEDQVEATYWPDYYNPPTYISNNTESDFLFKHIFHRNKNIVKVSNGGIETKSDEFNTNVRDVPYQNNNFVYRFPLGNENNKWLRIDNGSFSFKLSNRNVSSMKLTITHAGMSEVWEWALANNASFENTLHLKHTQSLGVSGSNSDKNDPYLTNHFYKDDNNAYKGTLTAKTSLTQAYTDYIHNTVPLSLPPDLEGDINLVNTDRLTFTIGQKPNTSGGINSITFRAYGEPLKFAPLVQDGNEVISAMQFRNACY